MAIHYLFELVNELKIKFESHLLNSIINFLETHVHVLFQTVYKLLTIYQQLLALVALQHVVVDKVRIIFIFRKQVQLFLSLPSPSLTVFVKIRRDLSHPFKPFLNQLLVLKQDSFLLLFSHIERISQLSKLVPHLSAQLVVLDCEILGQLFDLRLVNFVLSELVHNLVHGHKEFACSGDLFDYFIFLAHLVALVFSEKSAIGADTDSVVDANDFKFAFVLRAKFLSGIVHLLRLLMHDDGGCDLLGLRGGLLFLLLEGAD